MKHAGSIISIPFRAATTLVAYISHLNDNLKYLVLYAGTFISCSAQKGSLLNDKCLRTKRHEAEVQTTNIYDISS